MDRSRGWCSLMFGAVLLLSACGAASAPTGAPASPSAPASAASASAGVASSWDDMLAAAKREGKVVVGGPPEPETRTKLPEMMKQRFGIEVEYLTQTSSQIAARLPNERAANQYTVDVMLSGADTAYTVLLGQGWLEPLKPALLMPGVADPAGCAGTSAPSAGGGCRDASAAPSPA